MKSKIKKIVAVGDLHGAYDEFILIMKGMKLIEEKNLDWIAKDTHFIQMGDVCDRGYNSKGIYELLIKWETQAPNFNSKSSFLIGNHEVMNMFGMFHYNTQEEYKGFAQNSSSDGRSEFLEAFSKSGWLYNWIVKQKAIIKVNNYIFAHADFPKKLSSDTLSKINNEVIKNIKSNIDNEFASMPSPLFSQEDSILWCRRSAYDPDEQYRQIFLSYLRKNKASAYICGHTASRNFELDHEGSYLRIDTGIAPFYGGSKSALLIEEDTAYSCYITQNDVIKKEIDLRTKPIPKDR